MKVVEYWHGTINNYRYDGDVSTCCNREASSNSATSLAMKDMNFGLGWLDLFISLLIMHEYRIMRWHSCSTYEAQPLPPSSRKNLGFLQLLPELSPSRLISGGPRAMEVDLPPFVGIFVSFIRVCVLLGKMR